MDREFEGIEEDIRCYNTIKCDCKKNDMWQNIRFAIVIAAVIAMVLIKTI